MIEWEQGTTRIINAESALLAVQALRGSFADLERLVGADITEEQGRTAAIERIAETLSESARQQIANVLRLLGDETQSGRFAGDVYTTAQQHLALLGGLSPEERQTAAAIFRLLAEDERRAPTGQPKRLLGWIFRSKAADESR